MVSLRRPEAISEEEWQAVLDLINRRIAGLQRGFQAQINWRDREIAALKRRLARYEHEEDNK
jgi:hypothetical protein